MQVCGLNLYVPLIWLLLLQSLLFFASIGVPCCVTMGFSRLSMGLLWCFVFEAHIWPAWDPPAYIFWDTDFNSQGLLDVYLVVEHLSGWEQWMTAERGLAMLFSSYTKNFRTQATKESITALRRWSGIATRVPNSHVLKTKSCMYRHHGVFCEYQLEYCPYHTIAPT